ncbi:FAD-dependent oxidoreductase [Bosea sp. BK604]|uniref:dihydrolipoyl dehydrogenase family protein n=1 Tax=Bosea sp. BK604 TaxID=2512180 RepID=UPI0010D1D0F1|nr:FAD-dependent oxidoreductase [Bosea sp. BK604]TCR60843.1 pyruvate/2-oxoglutarate dehydrogenase complex dihydrolipoamide dehydrogenase (E3) component [Bosea sp. BK604]
MTDSSATAPKPAPLTPDLCVIGAGRAGLALASAAAAFGVPTVLIARDGMNGTGHAANLSATALIAAGAQVQAAREMARFGITAGEPQVNFAQVHDHMARAAAVLAPNATAERFKALGVTLIAGEARFRDRNSVQVGNQVIKARRFAIATGSRPLAPPVPGLKEVAFLSEDTIATLTRRPDRLIVLGGKPAGIALAQALQRLGSAVTIIAERGLLPDWDAEAVGLVRRALLREGVVLHEGTEVLRGETPKGRVRLILAGEPEQVVEGTHLLATDREPDIAALDLELGGITSDATGIIVNAGLRTGNRRVYAIGACAGGAAGGLREPSVADHHAGLVLRRALFRQPARLGAAAIPRLVQSEPALAAVGLSEAEARAKAGAVTVLRWPYAENDKAQAERRTEGFIKLVTDKRGRILGVTIVGAQAGELITPWSIAVQKGLDVKEMAGLVLPAPSLSEISGRAALSAFAPLATKPGLRRLIGFLRRFG